jgi:hypothetical protein
MSGKQIGGSLEHPLNHTDTVGCSLVSQSEQKDACV